MAELMNLTQGNMLVAKYEAKFTELSRYAANVITNGETKVKKFEMGFHPQLCRMVRNFEITKY